MATDWDVYHEQEVISDGGSCRQVKQDGRSVTQILGSSRTFAAENGFYHISWIPEELMQILAQPV